MSATREIQASAAVRRGDDFSPAAVAAAVLRRTKLRPTLGIVLGTGFQPVKERCTVVISQHFSTLPGFALPGVAGHEARLLLGYLDKTPVVLLCGRSHYYEGHSMEAITYPIRVLAEMGVKNLVLTNAAGGINGSFRPGDFMLITDHINFMGASPLRGPVMLGQKRFVDLTDTYNRSLTRLLKQAAHDADARCHEGVYLAVSGPNYETPAEVKAFAALGADAVGMSTVPEAIVARQCMMKVAAMSCITNQAARIGNRPVSHAEVLELGKKSGLEAGRVLENFARLYANR